jgi:hypothetical protein
VLKLNGSVIATSSSIYKSNSGYLFHPNLAIKADSSSEGTNCFLSKKEESPWLTLELKSETTIFNISVGVKDQSDGLLPSDYTLRGMTSLSVHVSNSKDNKNEIKTRCGDPWTYRMTKSIDLTCRGSLRGKFVHVTVPPSTTTYLAICSIVFNREEGALRLLNMSVQTASLASSGSTRTESLALAIDGIISPSKCTSLSGESNAWLRVEIGSVRYIGMIRILFAKGNRENTSVSVGRSLKSNGSVGNEKCGTVIKGSTAYGWKDITCSKSVFGQFIYIESSSRELQICEIQVFYGNIMDIYGTAYVSASDQQEESGSIWKPIDGMKIPTITSSWISLKSGKSWWKVKFPQRSAISQVFIYIPKWSDRNVWTGKLLEMNGFTVHIGDSTTANGKANRMCGSPQKLITRTTAIRIICGETAIFGKYLHVAAADRQGASIYLTEIVPHGCEEPNIEISRDTFNQRKELSCYVYLSTYSCPVTKTVLIGPDKQPINSPVERVKKSGHTIIKIFTVNSVNGLYTCSVHYKYKGGSSAKESTYSSTDLYSSPSFTTASTVRTSKSETSSMANFRNIRSTMKSTTSPSVFSLPSSTYTSMISSVSKSLLALKPESTLTTNTPSLLTSKSRSTLSTMILPKSTFTISTFPKPTLLKSTSPSVSAQPSISTPATDLHADSKGSDSVNVSAAAGSSLAAIIFILLLIILIRLRRRKRSMKRKDRSSPQMELQNHGDTNSKEVQNESVEEIDFERYVQRMHENGNSGFSSLYSLIDRNPRRNFRAAKSKDNKDKNRYNNIVPYDDARVILEKLPGIEGSDYINASYIEAYGQSRGYIACQGPSKNTIVDFWRMVWQEKAQTIVMVTNLKGSDGKIKCSCYWPALNVTVCYGVVVITFKEELVLSECTVRVFKLTV